MRKNYDDDGEVIKRPPGRPPGSKNKRTVADIDKARQEGELPHEFLLRISRGMPVEMQVVEDGQVVTKLRAVAFEERVDAAKSAAPYYAAKLQSVEVMTSLDTDELEALMREYSNDPDLQKFFAQPTQAPGHATGGGGVQAADEVGAGTRSRSRRCADDDS